MQYNKSLVSIIILAKDEGEGIERIIKSLLPYSTEIIVVDGHSKDQTKEVCKRLGIRYVLDHGKGRGDAVRLGMKIVKRKVILLFDADGSHNASDIPRFVKPILSNKADMVIGSRRTGGSFDQNMTLNGIVRSMGSDLLVNLVNRRFKTNLTDILYSFRTVRRSIVKDLQLKANGFDIEQEMVVKCLKSKCRLVEIPSREKARGWGKAKLKTITGVKFIFFLLRELYL